MNLTTPATPLIIQYYPFVSASSTWHNVFKVYAQRTMYQNLISFYGGIMFIIERKLKLLSTTFQLSLHILSYISINRLFSLADFFLSVNQWHMDWIFFENQTDSLNYHIANAATKQSNRQKICLILGSNPSNWQYATNVWNPWDFPGGPVGKTPCSHCRGPGFDPWSGN